MFRSLRFWLVLTLILIVTWGAVVIAFARGHDWRDLFWWAAIATLCLSGFSLVPRAPASPARAPAPADSSADDVALLVAGAGSHHNQSHHDHGHGGHDGDHSGGGGDGGEGGGGDGGGGD